MLQKWAAAVLAVMTLTSCGMTGKKPSRDAGAATVATALQDSLQAVARSYPGEIGIALITDRGDTVLVNNEDKYPLMSVFKLHQAISLCNLFDQRGTSLDSVVTLRRNELNPDTWSPMLKDHPGDEITVPIKELLVYTLTQSDNNASNWMFDNIEPVAATDSVVSTVIPRRSFRLEVTEADMWGDHSLCYRNHSSPLGAAELINRMFTDSILSPTASDFIRTTLRECKTGTDRIAAPLKDRDGVIVAHKTGSGFRDSNGILTAHNDVAFVELPGNRHYALAVLVKDFNGTESDAAAAIARISAIVYDWTSKSVAPK